MPLSLLPGYEGLNQGLAPSLGDFDPQLNLEPQRGPSSFEHLEKYFDKSTGDFTAPPSVIRQKSEESAMAGWDEWLNAKKQQVREAAQQSPSTTRTRAKLEEQYRSEVMAEINRRRQRAKQMFKDDTAGVQMLKGRFALQGEAKKAGNILYRDALGEGAKQLNGVTTIEGLNDGVQMLLRKYNGNPVVQKRIADFFGMEITREGDITRGTNLAPEQIEPFTKMLVKGATSIESQRKAGKKKEPKKEERTALQKEYDRYVKKNPEYTGDILQFSRDKKEQGVKTPTPVSWKNAADLVDRDFGKQDPMGNIIVTPELAGMRRIAQGKLVELQDEEGTPLAAVQKSIKFARQMEKDFWKQMEKAEDNEAMQGATKKGFEELFGYIPQMKIR